MQPITAPRSPIAGARKYPWPIMNTITIRPIPNAVPKLVREII